MLFDASFCEAIQLLEANHKNALLNPFFLAMRRASYYRRLFFALSQTITSPHSTTLSIPKPLPCLQYPLHRFIQSLSHTPTETSIKSIGGDERKLGLEFFKEAEVLEKSSEGEKLERALDFGLKALNLFHKSDGGWSIQVAKALRLLGSVSFKLKRFDESLESFHASVEIIDSLESDDCSDSEIGLLSIELNSQIAKIKTSIGKRWDALVYLKRVLDLKVAIFGPKNKELGLFYRDLAEAYAVVTDFNQALPLCFKSLEIQKSEFGDNSLEVAKIRELIGVIHTGLGEFKQGLEQIELARSTFEKLNLTNEAVQMEIDSSNVLILIGQLDEASDKLKNAIQKVEKESELKAFILVSIAKTLIYQQKFSEAKRCLEISCEILFKKESISPNKICEIYAEIGMLYESIAEFETALSLMKRALSLIQNLEEMQHLEGSLLQRVGWMLLFTKRVDQSIPYLENSIEKLKGCFGPNHFGLGFAYKHLGQAYLESGRPEMAVKVLGFAKEIVEGYFGEIHEDTIDVNQCLANAYGLLARYDMAIECQERVVKAYKKHGNSATEDLREASRLLMQLKKKADGSPSAVFPANSLPLPPPSYRNSE
ncbi:hypothetical protein LUZ60_015092 [Juncus effusus]|nr:hypothetical protein LUZ60_015092 [Juncus effusus]